MTGGSEPAFCSVQQDLVSEQNHPNGSEWTTALRLQLHLWVVATEGPRKRDRLVTARIRLRGLGSWSSAGLVVAVSQTSSSWDQDDRSERERHRVKLKNKQGIFETKVHFNTAVMKISASRLSVPNPCECPSHLVSTL